MSKTGIGAVLVVGGGIAGMQASLDLADSGYYVYLVESSSSIGGMIKPFRPMTVRCELYRPNWSRSAGTSTLNY